MCQILIESPLGSAFEDLERLIDEQTPYFKARIEELPAQARKVFHCLAEGWRPMQAREVADAAKLSSSHASAQLKQLMEKGYAREVASSGARSGHCTRSVTGSTTSTTCCVSHAPVVTV